jgi:hypothetical protein
MYCPKAFPGMICTYQDAQRVMTIMLFQGGKIMALGVGDMYAANGILMQVVAMASQFRMDPAEQMRKIKSSDRIARQRNTDGDDVARRGTAARAKSIAQRVHALLELNRQRAADTDFAREMKALITGIVADNGAAPAKRPLVDDAP